MPFYQLFLAKALGFCDNDHALKGVAIDDLPQCQKDGLPINCSGLKPVDNGMVSISFSQTSEQSCPACRGSWASSMMVT